MNEIKEGGRHSGSCVCPRRDSFGARIAAVAFVRSAVGMAASTLEVASVRDAVRLGACLSEAVYLL